MGLSCDPKITSAHVQKEPGEAECGTILTALTILLLPYSARAKPISLGGSLSSNLYFQI